MLASLELQRALVAALKADPVLAARGLEPFDGPPSAAQLPVLSVGADQMTDRGWKQGRMAEHRFGVTLWDAREGYAEVKAVLADVERAVLAMPTRVGLLRLVSLRLLRAGVRRGPRGWTQGSLEFRALSIMED